jgi:anti-sigma factor RsiW
MNASQSEPSREELEAMAYADGELSGEARAAFEALLPRRPDLVREVARHQRLNVLARHAAPSEPMDHEWRRLARDPFQRALLVSGWVLGLGGALLLVGWGLHALFTSDLALFPKLALAAVGLGFLALLLAVVRGRLLTRPYDPYTEIQR